MTKKKETQSFGTIKIKPPSEFDINNVDKWSSEQEVLVRAHLNGENEIDFAEFVKRVEKLKVKKGEL